MASGSCRRLSDLPPQAREVIESARRAVLATVDERGAPHAVPVSFAVLDEDLVTAVDQKPKKPGELVRVRNVRANPNVAMLFDRWDEDWERLAWVMVRGGARVEPPATGSAELSTRYPQYRDDPPRGDVIVITPVRVSWWSSA
jgi:PPOX class probable F420-dependent enzyme